MAKLRIIFMGTPEFAVPSLEILINNGYSPVAVVTAPDKPQGRGRKVVPSPVKACALEHHIPILQPTNLKAESFLEELASYKADLQIVVAFRMLPEAVWAMPAKGTFNLHASLLPDYRGAAPIHWAIINGEKETGVTTFMLQHEIDTGQILLQERESISDDDTVGTVYERLMRKGANLVLKTVRLIEAGNAVLVPQPDLSSKQAPKIFKETCEIDWNKTAKEIKDFVRGLNPFPSAFTSLNGKTYKIHQVSISDYKGEGLTGSISTNRKDALLVRAKDQWVSIDSFQPEGKKIMSVSEFLRGNSL